MVVFQIETRRAFEAREELLAVPGVDAVMIGPADLSISLGVPGEFEHPLVVETIEAIKESCLAHGVAPGIQTRNLKLAQFWRDRGMLFLGCSNELGMLFERAGEIVRGLRPESMKPLALALLGLLACRPGSRLTDSITAASLRGRVSFLSVGSVGRARYAFARARHRGRIHRSGVPARRSRKPGGRRIFQTAHFVQVTDAPEPAEFSLSRAAEVDLRAAFGWKACAASGWPMSRSSNGRRA